MHRPAINCPTTPGWIDFFSVLTDIIKHAAVKVLMTTLVTSLVQRWRTTSLCQSLMACLYPMHPFNFTPSHLWSIFWLERGLPVADQSIQLPASSLLQPRRGHLALRAVYYCFAVSATNISVSNTPPPTPPVE